MKRSIMKLKDYPSNTFLTEIPLKESMMKELRQILLDKILPQIPECSVLLSLNLDVLVTVPESEVDTPKMYQWTFDLALQSKEKMDVVCSVTPQAKNCLQDSDTDEVEYEKKS